jgi:hypothetical protein
MQFLVEFINNEKIKRKMMMCTSCMSNYYLCVFLEIIDNKKIDENDETDDDVYIVHVKEYTIRTYSELKI